MFKTITLLISICSLTLITLTSCTVDCEFVCYNYEQNWPRVTGWVKDIRKSECRNCDFPMVDEHQSAGYTCYCYEEGQLDE